MADWIVTTDGNFHRDHNIVRAALGKGGSKPEAEKIEGDGATPVGRYAIRRVMYRADRSDAPVCVLPVRPIENNDGWCDAAADPAYNRPVRLPYPASCETMTRDDGLYDVVVVLGHNDDPPVAGLGSAIFLHCAKPGYPPTQGCVALDKPDLLWLLARVQPGDYLVIRDA